MCSWRFVPGLAHEDHLVDAGRLVALAPGRATCSGVPIAPRSEPSPCCISFTPSGASSGATIARAKPRSSRFSLELLPDVRHARAVVAEDVVVRERVAEEVRAVDAALDRRRLVGVAHHRQHDGEVRVDREAARHALLGRDQRVVLVDPLPASSGSMNENDSAPMPLRAARWIVSRRLHATHSGGCGFCIGFGTTLRGGILRYSPS